MTCLSQDHGSAGGRGWHLNPGSLTLSPSSVCPTSLLTKHKKVSELCHWENSTNSSKEGTTYNQRCALRNRASKRLLFSRLSRAESRGVCILHLPVLGWGVVTQPG